MIDTGDLPGVAFGDADDGDARRDMVARRRLSDAFDIDHRWATIDQVHGTAVALARTTGSLGGADAVIAIRGGPPVVIATADCLPVVIRSSHAVAVVHAGWRGLASGVIEAAVSSLREFGDPTSASIGPHIGACCYEVGEEVVAAIGGFESTTRWGTRSVDLAAAAEARLSGLTVRRFGACTYEDDRLHSYRRDGTDERQVTVAWVPSD